MTPRNWCTGWSCSYCWNVIRGINVRSLGVTFVAGFLMFCVNCSFSCAYDMGVHVLLPGAARSSIFSYSYFYEESLLFSLNVV